MIKGIRKLAYFEIITGKTLEKLPWISKIPLKRNGMAAIPKMMVGRVDWNTINFLLFPTSATSF